MMMPDETTTEQLVEIDRDMAEIERQVAELVEEAQRVDYPQPQPQPQPVQVREGRWRTRGGEVVNVTPSPPGYGFRHVFPWHDARALPQELKNWRDDGHKINGPREHADDLVEYLGPIESQPEPQPQPQPVQVREGRWRTRGGHYVCVEPMSGDDFASIAYGYTWRGRNTPELQWNHNGLCEIDSGEQGPMDLVEYLGPIEQPELQPSPQPEPNAAAIEELRSEVSYVQNLLGTEKRRVTELEKLVGSLRTINEAQEKAFEAAGKENTALRNQLAAVKTELVTQAETSRQLRIELDAAQQVPADSPELRQLRADLAEVIQDRDTYRDGYNRVLSDLETARETAKAEAVEAIVEWLVPIRLVDHPNLANETLQHLPQIMRHLTGLSDEGIE